ncbi:UTRA domain-containing protein [Cohaesibacter sp. CAU 1516]|uniref:GntR family transcriptional regulator n=1 Tax=Cohaesibacter sp. CAU 1516 TaxID=2576038 RepID=UPI0010FE13CA|nr:GntR family transcriptional regulator [Cohaesibacter sp. CAU 1516]TLP48742.1 UTRA domain-containing protein [Cohaesibacter sp. CAU 1516]
MTSDQKHSWSDIRELIHSRILDATYRPGDKLPRDEDLALELGCARTTVHRAMRSLAESGIVERRRKGGTIVCTDPVTRTRLDIPVTRLEVEMSGAVYAYHMVDCRHLLAPGSVTAVMGLVEREVMLNIKALHLSDGKPFIYEDRWISLETVPEILKVDLKRQNANEWLVRNRPYNRCSVQLYAEAALGEIAEQMLVAPGSALLHIERTTWLNDAPITHVRATTAPGYRLSTTS